MLRYNVYVNVRLESNLLLKRARKPEILLKRARKTEILLKRALGI